MKKEQGANSKPKDKNKDKANVKLTGKELAKKLLFETEHVADISPKTTKKAFDFCENYKAYLDAAKTERLACDATVDILKKAGYTPFDRNKKYKQGDKIYDINRGKALIITTIGKKSMSEGVRIVASHIDSPRVDLKANPLYEDSGMALFKTHYYGGIRKYQWGATPLSLIGVVYKKDGTCAHINIGEDEKDPVFCITDLLPHLAATQNKRSLPEGLKGEELNIVLGSLPIDDKEVKDRIKLYIMQLLNEKYGITERDFTCAEIEAVPAFKAKDVGLDRSLIGAYAHDDRVCAYTSLMAEIETKNPEYTTACMLADKEEVGSDGTTGLQCDYYFNYLQELCQNQGADYLDMCKNSKCLSADVNVALDPTFPDVTEKMNTAKINHGVVVTKYTGARGKGGTNDANAEMVSFVARLLDDAGVVWQTGELGKVDQGGGGTVAKYIANKNVDVIDIGVPTLSMHSPFELVAKLDVFMTYKAFKAFFV